MKLHVAALSVGGVVALAVATAPAGANAPGYSLALSGAPTGTVGTPYQITGSGTDPTDQGALYLEIDSFPASFTTTCPSGYLTASQEAPAAGGSLVAFDERENFDSNGNFSNPNAFTAPSAGQWLFCGYTDDGATNTLATASLLVTFNNPGSQAQKPVSTKKPRVTRSGNQLRCTRGQWSTNSPTHFSYRWLVAGKPKAGATRAYLAITRKLRGHSVRCGVKASNAAGSNSVLSAPFRVR